MLYILNGNKEFTIIEKHYYNDIQNIKITSLENIIDIVEDNGIKNGSYVCLNWINNPYYKNLQWFNVKNVDKSNDIINRINHVISKKNILLFPILEYKIVNKIDVVDMIILLMELEKNNTKVVNNKNIKINFNNKQYNDIVVVGNGLKGLSNGSGKWVDSHDCVVRLNRFEINGYENKVGSKITHQILGSSLAKYNGKYLGQPHQKITLSKIKWKLERYNKINVSKFLFICSDRFASILYNFFVKINGMQIGSTGIFTIFFYLSKFIRNRVKLNIIGFSCHDGHFVGEENYYYKTKKTKNKYFQQVAKKLNKNYFDVLNEHHHFDLQKVIINMLLQNKILGTIS